MCVTRRLSSEALLDDDDLALARLTRGSQPVTDADVCESDSTQSRRCEVRPMAGFPKHNTARSELQSYKPGIMSISWLSQGNAKSRKTAVNGLVTHIASRKLTHYEASPK